MVGDSSVGKSNILLRYITHKFDEKSGATLGVEFESKYLTTEDGKKVRA